MKPRVLVTVGSRSALPVLAGLTRLPVEVYAAATPDMVHHVTALPAHRLLPLSTAGGKRGGEEILEAARSVRAHAVIPTGDADLYATAGLGWVFDLRGVALAAPASWTLAACNDPAALERAWPSGLSDAPGAGRAPAAAADTWWDVVVDKDGGLRWVCTRGAPSPPDSLARVGAAVRALGLRYAASLLTRATEDGNSHLVRVCPRFTPALGPVVARGVNVPRIVVELLLGRELPRATSGAPSTWAPANGGLALHA